MLRMVSEMERMAGLFEDLMRTAYIPGRVGAHETANIYESEKGYMIHLNAPGMKQEDMEVSFEDGVISIKAERKIPELSEGMKALRQERSAYSIHRNFRLTDSADVSKAEAKLENGQLLVFLPKKEDAQPKKIEVKVK